MQSGQQFDGDTLVSLASTLAQSEATLAEYSTKRPRANAAPNVPARGILYLVGAGMKATCHITQEAMVHLRAADVCFGGLSSSGPDRRWLELALGKPVLDLNQFYPDDPSAERSAAYVKGAEAICRELVTGSVPLAHEPCPPVRHAAALSSART